MSIVTWEWLVIIGMIVGWLGILTFYLIDHSTSLITLPIVGSIISIVILLSAAIFQIPLMIAQSKVENEYARYLEIKSKYYEALLTEDELDDHMMKLEVQKYNFWYSNNKDKLQNEWHLWGTSKYADEFDYIDVKE